MKKVAVFMLFGQSNATGHGVPMEEKDIILSPLKNVFGLNREPNQSFDTEKLKFTGYTSYGMNLAENQDNTYSVANCLARLWQDEIDTGANLPDLYIIQIAIGSQGVYGMWYPDREKRLIPGKLGDVDISLYPFTIHILSLLSKHFEENEIEPDFIGIHWRGGEQETNQHTSSLEGRLKNDYIRIFNGMREALKYDAPIVLHKMPFVDVMKNTDPTGKSLDSMNYINGLFEELASELPKASVFDPFKAPHYDPYAWDKNLFRWDLIHYNPKTNNWVASEILNEYKSRS
ncbi:MAG: SGNH/GDSL hydrolase family protein [Clostridia bacterium]|nr:SGNH/GDSL hydrolase family protein [Clostridia bacterium]